MARLLLIENFSQYPARRLEIQSALQFLSVHTWTPHKSKKDIDQRLNHNPHLDMCRCVRGQNRQGRDI